MNRKNIFMGIVVISFVASVFMILKMPDTVPTHWNASGEIDDYGSKWNNLILAGLPLLTYFGMDFTKKIDPKREKIEKRKEVYEFFKIILSSVFIILNWLFIYAIMNQSVNISFLITSITGILLIITGNYMPRIPQNYFLGFKLPWALENERVWVRTQRMGGIAMVFSGAATFISGFINSSLANYVLIGVTLISILLATIDSYLYFKRITNQQ